jgi:peptidoglycan/LPS O-acetylase OafA/YrhL
MGETAAVPVERVRIAAPERRVPELDGIRAVAIWMVLLAHAFYGFANHPSAMEGWPTVVKQVVGHGWLGVDLFFLLSGFLITGILLETKTRPRYFQNFYIRRALRIMPLYFSVIIVWAICYSDYLSYFLLSIPFAANLSSLLHVPEPHGPAVLWSLAVEEHFYLVWPILVLLSTRVGLFRISAFIFLGTPLLRAVFAARGMNADLIYMLSWFRFDGLATGAMIALWASSRFYSAQNGRRIAVAMIVADGLLTLGSLQAGVMRAHSTAAVGLRYTQTYLFFGALFVLVVSHRGTIWTSPLRWRLMQLTGAVSYCLYLVHLSIGDAYVYLLSRSGIRVEERLGPTGAVLLRATVMVVVSFGVALLSRRYLEEPFLALKGRFASRRPSAAVVNAPAEPEPSGV